MKAIRKGNKGKEITKWQYFLHGFGYKNVVASGTFDDITDIATRDFQLKHALDADGVVGNQTFAKAMAYGYPLVDDEQDTLKNGPNWPEKPPFGPLTPAGIKENFGKFQYKVNPDSTIKILGNWESENIVTIASPWISQLPPYKLSKLRVHKKVADRFIDLFEAWKKAGLLNRVNTFDGCFYPRLIRGSATNLSTHSYGIAFDINASTNGLGKVPPLLNANGCVRELVPIANDLGWYWGGHFSRMDGMHFEIAQI
ncbi:MAG: M15 family metallopeptidase [Flavobacteriales bacterium]